MCKPLLHLAVDCAGCTCSVFKAVVQVRRPAAGKRKAAEAAQAVPEGVSAHDLANDGPAGLPLELTATDNSPEAANTGPMTKAKKRKGMTQPPSTPPALAVL